MDLVALLTRPDGKTLEFKQVRGISEPLDPEERLANLISDQVSLRLVPEIESLAWRHLQVVALQVPLSPTQPHYLKREGPDGGVYVRDLAAGDRPPGAEGSDRRRDASLRAGS